MDVDFDVCRALGAPPGGGAEPSVVRVDDASLGHPRWGGPLRDLLDALGERSRRAQGLGKPVTCGRGSLSGQRVYLLADGHSVLGLLKVGPKRLYVARGGSCDGLVEITPLCSLDFYVVEGRQRGGLGLRLFQAMLRAEGIAAERMAYDRPSPKFVGFLQKHFGLSKYTPQSNHFVVFDRYFSAAASVAAQKAPPAEGSRAGQPEPRPHRQTGTHGLAGTAQAQAGPGCLLGQSQQDLQGSHGYRGLASSRGSDGARGPPPVGHHARAPSTPTSTAGRPYSTYGYGGSAAADPAERPPQALDRSSGRAAAASSGASAGRRRTSPSRRSGDWPARGDAARPAEAMQAAGQRSGGHRGSGPQPSGGRSPSPLHQAARSALASGHRIGIFG